MKTIYLSLAALSLTAVACAPAAAGRGASTAMTTSASTLDGKTFDVTGDNVPADQPKTIDIAFANGTFQASPCKAMGQAPIPYTVAADGTFRAERHTAQSDDVWSGRVVGNDVEGRLVSTAKNGKTLMDISFRGQAR